MALSLENVQPTVNKKHDTQTALTYMLNLLPRP